jgi:hypothetical protein
VMGLGRVRAVRTVGALHGGALVARMACMVRMIQVACLAVVARRTVQRSGGAAMHRAARQHHHRGHALQGHRGGEQAHQQESDQARHGRQCSAAALRQPPRPANTRLPAGVGAVRRLAAAPADG